MNDRQGHALLALSKTASWEDVAKYSLMYGAPTVLGAILGALSNKKKRFLGGSVGALAGAGVGGLIHGALEIEDPRIKRIFQKALAGGIIGGTAGGLLYGGSRLLRKYDIGTGKNGGEPWLNELDKALGVKA